MTRPIQSLSVNQHAIIVSIPPRGRWLCDESARALRRNLEDVLTRWVRALPNAPYCSRLFGVLCKHRPIIKGLVLFPGSPPPPTLNPSAPPPISLLIPPLCKGFDLMSILTARAPMCALRCRHNNGVLISLQLAGAFIHTSAAAPAQSPSVAAAAWPPLLALGVNSPPPPCLRLVWDVWEIPSLASPPPSPRPPHPPFTHSVNHLKVTVFCHQCLSAPPPPLA